ncbi:YbbR-like domain-containing protein [Dysosmobacter sp.]|uniref:CdaR family protein n=1 Tax=Dysosmobacter sp. TaxID=2591382 RepID=UPI003A8FB6C5
MERKKMDRQKAMYLALSCLVAVTLWIFVDLTGDNGDAKKVEIDINNIPIEYLNTDTVLAQRGLMLLEEGTTQTVNVKLTASTRWNSTSLDRSAVRATVDLADVTETGTQRLNITILYPDGTEGISKKSSSPSMATVNIGELYHKEVEVRCERVGTVAEGYSAGELELSPSVLEIRGQKEDIDPVSYVKVVLNYDDATSTITQELDFQYYDANDQLLSGDGIHPTVDKITATLPVNVTKELTLTMNFIQSPGARLTNTVWDIEPRSILVSGDAELLKDVETIVLDDFDLASLDSNTRYSYTIPLPEGCENLSGVTKATLTISFKDMKSAPVTTTRIQCENVPEGKVADVLTEQLTVVIYGTSADVDAVTGSDLLAVADLTDFGSAAGTYTVPVEIRSQRGDLGISGTYQIRVTLRDTQDEEPDQNEPSEDTPSDGETQETVP